MQQLSTYEINQISGGLTGLQTAAIIVTLPVTVPLGIISSFLLMPAIAFGAATKLGNNIADYYSGWDQVTGWNKPSNQG